MNREKFIKTAQGLSPCDVHFKNARIVDVFSGQIFEGSLAVYEGRIVGFGDYPARCTRDLEGRFIAPGFIDSHVHIESSMTCASEFARAVLAHGTTAVVADPHEIANVLGVEGLRYMLASALDQPIEFFFTLPSCVPATDLETAGATLTASDLEPFFQEPRIVALGEMMNFPGVLGTAPDVLKKIEAARRNGKVVDGHAPGLSGRALMAYVAAGITSDHECTTAAEALEKLAAGMHIMIRQGTGARNLFDLLPIVTASSAQRLMWCTDDRHPQDLLSEGHIDSIVVEAIRSGLDPLTALRMATLHPAERFGLTHLGAVAPGRLANLVVFSDLASPWPEEVYVRGELVAQNGQLTSSLRTPTPLAVPSSMNVDLRTLDFTVPAAGRLRVIEVIPGQIVTRQSIEEAPVAGNSVVSDASRDLLKIAVIERHTGSGRIGIGMVRGFGLQQGALASSVAHDSHNIIVTGVADADLRTAVEEVVAMGGGLAAAAGGRIVARLPLPVAGLMSQAPVQVISHAMDQLVRAAHDLGSRLKDPFMALSFLALPVIPELKITDKGLVDVPQFKHVPLWVPNHS
jgi:adenine deaminase